MQIPTGFSYLSERLPVLAASLPRVPLGDFPTRVMELPDPHCNLFVKCDNESGLVYGGNKLRKLEYLFGQALHLRAGTVATFGAASSNHVLATAVHARRLGLEPVAFLSRQPPTPMLSQTLKMHRRLGTRIIYWGGDAATRRRVIRDTIRALPDRTWVIPSGGSSWIGAIGYINAAFELTRQIAAGLIARPDRIYLPLGTMGTVAGLAIGLAAAGVQTKIVAVRVVPDIVADRQRLTNYINKIVTLCGRLESGIQDTDPIGCIEFRDDQFGPGYARATPAAITAVAFASAAWGLQLETTYSGKAMAALLKDRQQGVLKGKNVLFWNTFNSTRIAQALPTGNRSELPEELQAYID